MFSRHDSQVTHDGREIPRLVGERERSEGVERLEDVSLAGDERTAECGVEEIFLDEPPAEQLLGIGVSFAAVEALRDSVLDFICVCKGFVFVEAKESGEIGYAVDQLVGDVRLDYMFPFRARVAPYAFERRRTNIEREFLSGAKESLAGKCAIKELPTVMSGAKREHRSDVKPGPPVEGNCDGGSDFASFDKARCVEGRDIFFAMLGSDESLEREIDRQIMKRRLIDGAEIRFRGGSQPDLAFGRSAEKVLVAYRSHAEAEALEIIVEKGGVGNFRVDRLRVSFAERQPEGKRRQLVKVGNSAPSIRQIRDKLHVNFMATLVDRRPFGLRKAAVNYAEVAGIERSEEHTSELQ